MGKGTYSGVGIRLPSPAFSYTMSIVSICAMLLSSVIQWAGSRPRTMSTNASSWYLRT